MTKEIAVTEAIERQYLVEKEVENIATKKRYIIVMVSEAFVTNDHSRHQVLCSFASTDPIIDGDVKRLLVEEIGFFLKNYLVVN